MSDENTMRLIAHGASTVGLRAEYESTTVDTAEAIEQLAGELEEMDQEEIYDQLSAHIEVDEIVRE